MRPHKAQPSEHIQTFDFLILLNNNEIRISSLSVKRLRPESDIHQLS